MKLTTNQLRQIIKEAALDHAMSEELLTVTAQILKMVTDACGKGDDDALYDSLHPDVYNILVKLVETARTFKL